MHKRVKAQKENIKKFKLLGAFFSSDRDFFREVKNIRGHAKNENSVIDGLTENGEIAQKFTTLYRELFNSNPSNTSELFSMMETLCQNIKTDSSSLDDCLVTIEQMREAINRLKCEKKDGVYDTIASDHFINATDSFYDKLLVCVLFSKCLLHGYMPGAMILSTLVPIPKDNNDMQSSEKYRGIALSAICNKLFEYIILLKYGHMLCAGDLQFAYKADSSTKQCTWMAREVITYYNNNGSDVYSCLLDCSKAFDRIRHDKLLRKLVSKGLPPVITRSLMNMYVNSQVRVKWKNVFSEPFNATNGVKQGSVISPILFTLCLDDLIDELEDNGDGCWIGKQFYGIVGFADDLKLLSPSLLGLQRMLDICKTFSDSTGLVFNARKTMCIKFHHGNHTDVEQYPIYLGHDKLVWCNQVKHLGHIFNCCVDFAADVSNRKGQFIGCVNNIISQFGFAHPACKVRLLVTHGYSFYGSSLWNLYGND